MDNQTASEGTAPLVNKKPEDRVYDVALQDQQKIDTTLARPIILGDLTLASPTTFTTIGSNGAASALTANPVGYLVVIVGNTSVQIPYYNLA